MSNISPDQYPQFIKTSTAMLRAMSNAKRLQILTILLEEEISVTSLAELIGLSQSALSQHLSILRYAELVSFRRESQTVYYRCEATAVRKVFDILNGFFAVDKDIRNAERVALNVSG